jgi:hypothetical protein
VRSCVAAKAAAWPDIHPEYRERYAANLRRELSRVPFASVGKEQIPPSGRNDKTKEVSARPASAGDDEAGLQIPPSSRNDKTKGVSADSAGSREDSDYPLHGFAGDRRRFGFGRDWTKEAAHGEAG